MVIYECKICNFSSKLIGNFKKHLNTKKHGRNINPNYNIGKEIWIKEQNEHKMNTKEHKMNTNEHKIQKSKQKNLYEQKHYMCDHCGTTFKSIPSKRRHELHYCTNNSFIINSILRDKDKQISKLEKTVDKLTDRIGNTTNIQNNTIKINNYGNEDLSHITDSFKTSLLSGPYGAIPKMIEAIHFNKDKPENNNIILPNLNKNILKIKKGDKWIHKNKEMIIYDMIDSKYLMLDDHFNLIINGDTLNKYTKDIFQKFRTKYDDGNKELLTTIKEDCDLMIMNNRDSEIK
jgi:protein-arginine kinase activator protein McsA